MSIDKELKRILENPENIIVSDELTDMLSYDGDENHEKTKLTIKNSDFVCDVKEVKISGNETVLTLSLRSPLLSELFSNKEKILVTIEENLFQQTDNSSIFWKNDDGFFLTLTTRRIFNEEVQD